MCRKQTHKIDDMFYEQFADSGMGCAKRCNCIWKFNWNFFMLPECPVHTQVVCLIGCQYQFNRSSADLLIISSSSVSASTPYSFGPNFTHPVWWSNVVLAHFIFFCWSHPSYPHFISNIDITIELSQLRHHCFDITDEIPSAVRISWYAGISSLRAVWCHHMCCGPPGPSLDTNFSCISSGMVTYI